MAEGEGGMSDPGTQEALNIESIRRVFDAYAAHDFAAVEAAFGDDALFHRVPIGPMRDSFRGPPAIVEYLVQLVHQTGGTMRLTPLTITAGGPRVLVLYRITGTRNDKTLDANHILDFTLADGLITEAVMFARDYEALTAFWS
jgi:uncharacterized protein